MGAEVLKRFWNTYASIQWQLGTWRGGNWPSSAKFHDGRLWFEELGMRLSREELEVAFRRFKELADTSGAVPVEAVFEGVTA